MTDPFKPNVPIKINSQQLDNKNTRYHTVRYYFKPQSIKNDSFTGTVSLPTDAASAKENRVEMKLGQSVFGGTYEIKPNNNITHECALIYNPTTNSFSINRLYGGLGGLRKKDLGKEVLEPGGTTTRTLSPTPPVNDRLTAATSPIPYSPPHHSTPPPQQSQYNEEHSLNITPMPTKKRKLDQMFSAPPPTINTQAPGPSPGGPISLGGQRLNAMNDDSSEESSSGSEESSSGSDDSSDESGSDSDSDN